MKPIYKTIAKSLKALAGQRVESGTEARAFMVGWLCEELKDELDVDEFMRIAGYTSKNKAAWEIRLVAIMNGAYIDFDESNRLYEAGLTPEEAADKLLDF